MPEVVYKEMKHFPVLALLLELTIKISKGAVLKEGPGKSSQNFSAVGAHPHTLLQGTVYLDYFKHLPPTVKIVIDKTSSNTAQCVLVLLFCSTDQPLF